MTNHVYFDEKVQCQFGRHKQVRVPTHPGGSDSDIYVDGSKSEYQFGPDGLIYKIASGRYVSNLPIADFARNYLWKTGKLEDARAPLFLRFYIFYGIIFSLIDFM